MIIMILIVLFVLISVVSLGFLTISWSVHVSQVKDFTSNYGHGSFKDFKREFAKYKWDNEGWLGNSLWDRKENCRFHANIVEFNNIGMIMKTPFDYVAMNIFTNHYIKVNKLRSNDKIIRDYNWSSK